MLKKLKKGDTIGVIAISTPTLDESLIDKGLKYIEDLGYKVVCADNIRSNENYFSGSVKTRANTLMKFFQDESIDAIIALKGGFGAIQVLELLDFDVIKKNPKIFVGYSDLTALQAPLYSISGLVNFQGPMIVSNFANEKLTDLTVNSLFSMLDGTNDVIADDLEVLYAPVDSVEGTMVGGNLATFVTLFGTKFHPDIKDKILYFEDVDEKTYSIDRMLSQLLLHKDINSVKAFVFGTFEDVERRNDHELQLNDLFVERLQSLGVPIVCGVQSGHCHPMLTVPIGADVSLDIKNGVLKLAKPVVQ